jgi:hypothetical protein
LLLTFNIFKPFAWPMVFLRINIETCIFIDTEIYMV